MNQDGALEELGTALYHILQSQIEKGSTALQLAAHEVLSVPGGRILIEIEMLPYLSLVWKIQPGASGELKEMFRIEGGLGRVVQRCRAQRAGEN